MKKKVFIFIGIAIILLIGTSLIYYFNRDDKKVDNEVSYAISFKKSKGNNTYYTYFYINDDNYYYVQVISTYEEENGTYVNEVTDSGYFYNPNEIIEIANTNNSFDLITVNIEIGDYSKGDVITEEELDLLLNEMTIYEK